MSSVPIPITASNEHEGPTHDALIGRLVEHFYGIARADQLLGSVFENNVNDWDRHLATMRDFWSSAVDRTGRYSGSPFAAHQKLSGLSDDHFERWLDLWVGAVRDVIPAPEREPFLDLATRMRLSMAARLGLRPAPIPNYLTQGHSGTGDVS